MERVFKYEEHSLAETSCDRHLIPPTKEVIGSHNYMVVVLGLTRMLFERVVINLLVLN